MGRKKLDDPRKTYTVQFTASEIEEFERLSNKLGISRSLLIRNLSLIGLDDVKGMERLGILKLCLVTQDMYRKIRNKIIREGEDAISLDDFKDEK